MRVVSVLSLTERPGLHPGGVHTAVGGICPGGATENSPGIYRRAREKKNRTHSGCRNAGDHNLKCLVMIDGTSGPLPSGQCAKSFPLPGRRVLYYQDFKMVHEKHPGTPRICHTGFRALTTTYPSRTGSGKQQIRVTQHSFLLYFRCDSGVRVNAVPIIPDRLPAFRQSAASTHPRV